MKSGAASKSKNLSADIVVVGGGGAGLAAAVTAGEKGASVIVVESRRVTGGNTAMALGLFSSRSPGEEGKDISYSNDEYFKKSMKYAHWRTNPRLVRALIDKSGDIVEWLEKQGVEFGSFTMGPGQLVYRIKGPGKGGSNVMKALGEKCRELGVHILCQARGRKLLMQKKKVTGVLAETEDGEVRINAGSVILATGGMAGNRDLLKRYFTSFAEKDELYLGGIPNQGDGLTMAMEIGAATDGTVLLEISGLVFPGSDHLSCLARHPKAVWVNKRGERFIDESVSFPENTNAIFRQPAKVFYALFDKKSKEGVLEDRLSPMDAMTIPAGTWPSQVDSLLESQIEKGRVKITDSLEEIERWIGAGAGALAATVNEYNTDCDRGRDPLFAKSGEHLLPLRRPPYYAVKCCANLLVTHGDIKINHRMEVVDKRGLAIPGLYAVGDDIGDIDSGAYNIGLPGHSFGFAINSGRIAAENALSFIQALTHK